MQSFLKTIRFYILSSSLVVAFVIYLVIRARYPTGSIQTIKLQEWYGFSIVYLYICLLITPVTSLLSSFPGRTSSLLAQRAVGVSAWFFALLHASLGFWGQLGGFKGLGFLSGKYLLAISLSAIALCLLSSIALTAFEKVHHLFPTRGVKYTSHMMYVAGVFILIHVVMLGSHFQDLLSFSSQLLFSALAFLLLLEGLRTDRWMRKKYTSLPQFGLAFVVTVALVLAYFLYFFIPVPGGSGNLSFGIHAAHLRLAEQVQSGGIVAGNGTSLNTKIPGLDGDPTKRYSVQFATVPENPLPNQQTELHFRVTEAQNGNPVNLFKVFYTKTNHTIVVDNTLSYFSHIHATQEKNEFVVKTLFPKDSIYHIYISFQPFGAIEQQFGFSLPVGTALKQPAATDDQETKKTVGKYKIAVQTPESLSAENMSLGKEKISFTLTNAQTGKPVTTLKPYLSSLGHVTMINTTSYDFIHVHPYALSLPQQNQPAGPQVDFLPIGIYGKFKPGIYRVFAEFNPDDILTTALFTLHVK